MWWRAKWLPGDRLMRRGAVFDGEEPGEVKSPGSEPRNAIHAVLPHAGPRSAATRTYRWKSPAASGW